MDPLEAEPAADPAAWIAKAKTDLVAADRLLGAPHLEEWPAGFHLQ